MKNIMPLLALMSFTFALGQRVKDIQEPLMEHCLEKKEVPLRTYNVPENECYYLKDTMDELKDYEGTWKGTWDNKTLYITFKKLTGKYDIYLEYYMDFLIAKFKVLDSNGNILFDNTADPDNEAKIEGSTFAEIGAKSGPNRDIGGKYSLLYFDESLCDLWGGIYINFSNPQKTQMQFDFNQKRRVIFPDCYYYNYPTSQYPRPLPNQEIVLTKQ